MCVCVRFYRDHETVYFIYEKKKQNKSQRHYKKKLILNEYDSYIKKKAPIARENPHAKHAHDQLMRATHVSYRLRLSNFQCAVYLARSRKHNTLGS